MPNFFPSPMSYGKSSLSTWGNITSKTNAFQYMEGRNFYWWIDTGGRSNGYATGDLIAQPAYVIESIIRDELAVEREALIKQATSMGFRFNDITGVSIEGLTILGKLVVNYSEAGGITFAEAANKVFSRLKDVKLTRDDLVDATLLLSRSEQVNQKAQGERIIESLNKQERELDNLDKDQDIPTMKRAVKRLSREVKNGGYTQRRLDKINAKIRLFQDAIERNELIRPKNRAADPETIAERKAILSDLRKIMNAKVKAADIRQRIANGEPINNQKLRKPKLSPALLKARADLALARREMDEYIASRKPLTLKQVAIGLANINKPIIWAFDLSVTTNQLYTFASANPIIVARAIGTAITKSWTRASAEKTMQAIKDRPLFSIFQENGLIYKEPNAEVTQSEEYFDNVLYDKLDKWLSNRRSVGGRIAGSPIRVITQGVKVSNRAFALPINQVVHNVAENIYVAHGAEMTEADLKQMTGLLNTLVGRGQFGRTLETVISAFQRIGAMGAPRLYFSKWATPFRLTRALGNRHLRAFALRQLGAYLASRLGLLILLDIAAEAFDWPVRVGLDWRKSDFLYIIVGNQHIDITGGVRSIIRSCIKLSQKLNLSTEPPEPLKYGETDALGELSRMVTNRTSPSGRLHLSLATGRDWMGKPITRLEAVRQGFMPLTGQDIYDVVKSGDGIGGPGTGAISFFGIPSQVWENDSGMGRAKWHPPKLKGVDE